MLLRLFFFTGIVVALLVLSERIRGLRWFGSLPGDLTIRTATSRIQVPLVSMLLVSLALAVLSWFLRRLA